MKNVRLEDSLDLRPDKSELRSREVFLVFLEGRLSEDETVRAELLPAESKLLSRQKVRMELLRVSNRQVLHRSLPASLVCQILDSSDPHFSHLLSEGTEIVGDSVIPLGLNSLKVQQKLNICTYIGLIGIDRIEIS